MPPSAGLREHVARSWDAHEERLRLEWQKPVDSVAAEFGLDADALRVALDRTQIRAAWNSVKSAERSKERVDLTMFVLESVMSDGNVQNSTRVLPWRFRWHGDDALPSLGRILEECLRIKVEFIGYGYPDSHSEDEHCYVRFGARL